MEEQEILAQNFFERVNLGALALCVGRGGMDVDRLKGIVTPVSSCDGRSGGSFSQHHQPRRQRWAPRLPPITKTALLPSFLSYKKFARRHNWSRSRASDPQHLHRLQQRNTDNLLHPSFGLHQYPLASVSLPPLPPVTFLSAHSTTKHDTTDLFLDEYSPSLSHSARLYYDNPPPQHRHSSREFAIPRPGQCRAHVPRNTKHPPPLSSQPFS